MGRKESNQTKQKTFAMGPQKNLSLQYVLRFVSENSICLLLLLHIQMYSVVVHNLFLLPLHMGAAGPQIRVHTH